MSHFVDSYKLKVVKQIQLSDRQKKIVDIVKSSGPITGEQIADQLGLTRATLRPDLAILTMSGILEARPRVGYYYKEDTSQSTLLAETFKKLRVKDIKSVPVVVTENISIYDAIVTMFIEDVGTLIVVKEGGILAGVVSRKDLLKTCLGRIDLNKTPVSVVMTRMPNIITVTGEDTVLTAAKKMVEHEIDALPVVKVFVNEDGEESLEVVGRITKTNITGVFLELGEKL
ncbi:MAG: DeoR family transcriptional regulator, catabolite repression regulator [Clostridia bacterium]|jgi:CBS domain-containing protein/biotin operon repressor|nr:putative transcriptional regulator [Clostridiales bacterium]MDK2984967.1 DeoR family transcriptional regulator, catabolite repression regulator [Clostridia bacterium]